MFQKLKPVCQALLATAVIATLPPAAVAAPKTLQEMWKIIQSQQAQIQRQQAEIEALKKADQQTTRGSSAADATAPATAGAGSDTREVARKTDILADEVAKLKTSLAIPEEPQYKSQYGLGPAASKIYQVNRGLSIGGYGEGFYSHFFDDETRSDRIDLLRLVTYIGYKFSDDFLFNSEIEYEHATTGEGAEEKGEVSVEFANLDYFLDPRVNLRAGLLLVPMGFINEIHEPPFFHGNNRPQVERSIIPTTWRELGAGLFGEVLPGLQYRLYAVNSLSADQFGSNGIRDGRQSGSEATANDFAVTGRMDYTPASVSGLLVGGSFFLGNSGQGRTYAGVKADAFTQLYEAHAQYRYRGFEFRALGVLGYIDDTEILSAARNEVIGDSNYGLYAEVAYDIMPWLQPSSAQYLAPFFRYERLDTLASQIDSRLPTGGQIDWEIFQAGLSYKPIPNVVLKADYRNIGSRTAAVADELNLGLGFIF